MIKADYTPTERFEALAYFFGWQGGTCHQIDKATGCKDSLTRPLARKGTEEWSEHYKTKDAGFDSASGRCGISTCGRDWRRNVLAPKFHGNWIFWTGAIEAYWATGALGGDDFSQRFGNNPANAVDNNLGI